MGKPLVSILIPAFNSEAWIDETIGSVLVQTWPNIEIIVVDDGSTDFTLERVKKFEEKGVKVISQSNKGAGAARNRAFQESSGEYIQYLDADDLLAPDKIEKQMLSIDGESDKTISSSVWGIFFESPHRAEFRKTELWQNFDTPVDYLITAWIKREWLTSTAWLTPRKLIENAGPWNEALSLHDDGEFFCRVLLKSDGVKFCPEAKSYYRKGIHTSLSSRRNLEAIASHFAICELYQHHLLNYECSGRTKNACAANYQSFIYDHYPHYPTYLNKAALQVTNLGGTDIAPVGSPAFMKLTGLVGWKLAKRLETFAYNNKINRSALKEKFQKFIGK